MADTRSKNDLTRNGETRLLNEWLAATHSKDLVFTRVRLGAAIPSTASEGLTAAELSMLGVFRRWADAAVVTDRELIIVEAKVKASPAAPGQLHLYAELVPYTPDLQPYLDRPLVLQLLCAVQDPAVSRLCVKFGIREVVYVPEWLPIYLGNLYRRETTPPADFATRTSGAP
jgi:hypothetical protein